MAHLTVKEAFAAGGRIYQAGEIVDASDPIVAGRELLFVPVAVTKRPAGTVEQATAAPGEKRPGRRSRSTGA